MKRILIEWKHADFFQLVPTKIYGVVSVFDHQSEQELGKWNITVSKDQMSQYPIGINDQYLPFIQKQYGEYVSILAQTYFNGLIREKEIFYHTE